MWIKLKKLDFLKIVFIFFLTITISNAAKSGSVTSADSRKLHGLWLWTGTDIRVRVSNCSYDPDRICAIIVSNQGQGSYILKSLTKENNIITGKMIHPKDGRSYDAEIKILATGKVSISGCTAGRTKCQDSIWLRQRPD